MNVRPECFGGMFPDLSTEKLNTPLRGRAFDLLVISSGFGITERTSSANLEGWNHCTGCPEYRDCYQLGIGKLLLHIATQEYGVARAL
jgi:hypothetical protein